MKTIIFSLLLFPSLFYCQSSIVYGTGTNINIGSGADVCAGTITVNGTFTGSGTFCSGPLFVEEANMLNPSEFMLAQNYPNPFNPTTIIHYELPVNSNVNIKVYDILGNEISTLVNDQKAAGRYEINFNGNGLSSGVYYYQLKAGTFIETKKFILLK